MRSLPTHRPPKLRELVAAVGSRFERLLATPGTTPTIPTAPWYLAASECLIRWRGRDLHLGRDLDLIERLLVREAAAGGLP
jgi:hypothetical protein